MLTTRFVKSRTQIDATNWKEGFAWYDGLGRTYKTQSIDSNGDVFTETEFDDQGRPKRATNPYRSGETKVWTTTNYDTAGRAFEVMTADGAKVKTSYGVAVTGNQIGTFVTVTDQALKQRRAITNALGQLTRVDEPDETGNLGDVASPTQPTFYNYDSLGNLVKVLQGSQNRYFMYDSLGRLMRVKQPEQGTNAGLALSDPITGNSDWSSGSTYDNNGNIVTTTDAKNVVSSYAYDNLNRPLTRVYNDGTPNISYQYDNVSVPFSKGKLTKVSSSISTTEYTAFDNLGKILSHRQTTDGNAYTTAYGYNLSGALVQETYPSGRIVKNTLDNDGNLAIVESQKLNQVSKVYANSFKYTSAGALSSLRLGNGRFESTQYNSRLQPIQIGLGSSATAPNLLKLSYDFGGSDNNGNVKSQTINTGTATFTQTYQYDSLNRLTEAKEESNNQQTWKQNFGYDRFGNRTAFNEYTGNVLTNNQTPQVDAGNNRFTTASGFVYDLNGNLIQDNQNRQFTYNGDNKQTLVKDVNNHVVGQYYYNGDGLRVKKVSDTETTIFVYDASNRLVAEYSTQIEQNPHTSYLTTDNLGSVRIITNESGQVASRKDYQPFGEEVTRTNYGNSSVRQGYTGYQKDGETNLDYAINRYHSASNGRFTQADPYNIILEKEKGKNAKETFQILVVYISQPQIWNKYTYSLNNPINLSDPDGRRPRTRADYQMVQRFIDFGYARADEIEKEEGKDAAEAFRQAVFQAAVGIFQAIDSIPNEAKEDPKNLRALFWSINKLGDVGFSNSANNKNAQERHINSQGWNASLPALSNKCNLFVAAAYVLGANTGFKTDKNPDGYQINSRGWGAGAFGYGNVPVANDIVSNGMANFMRADTPSPGDIVIQPAGTGAGHNGILVGGMIVISANNGNGVRVGEMPRDDKTVYMRYKP